MELVKPFGIRRILNPESATEIYKDCSEQLRSRFSTRRLIEYFKVETICTTDTPLDSLDAHRFIKSEGFKCNVFPAFRPDKSIEIENTSSFKKYVEQLGEVAGITINSFNSYLDAIKSRHDYFHEMGCRLSDHGLESLYLEDFTNVEVENIFRKVILNDDLRLTPVEVLKFKTAMLLQFSEWDWERGWIQQFHLGALRGVNDRLIAKIGNESGFDSIGDFPQAAALGKFLNRLDKVGKLTKTIIYNLNPADNEVFATMIGNFNDGSIQGKIQWGSAWWFLDQKDGMEKHINALSNMGLISQFIGMLTDSRSFLSYSRHEYFRRILCNLFANDVLNSELPNDPRWIGKLIQDICYYNAKRYFDWH
jgi:glucuronate isomerase